MAIKTLVCLSCGNEKSLVRDFYSSSSSLYKTIRRLPMCKTCVDELYNNLVTKLKDDKVAAKRLFVMLDVYYDEDLYNSCIEKSIKEDISWLGEYMRLKANVKYKDKSSLNNIGQYEIVENIEIKDEEDIMEEVKNTSFKITNKMIRKWGKGFKEDDYIFLEDKYKDYTSVYECRTPAQRTIFEQICKCLLRLEKAVMDGDDTRFDKLNNSLSKLMNDGNIKPIQEADSVDDDAFILGKWINRIEQERPIGEASDEFKDVDGIGNYITKWFTKQMYKVFDLEDGEKYED